MAHQPPNNIPAHSAQTNHAKFHNISLVDEFCRLWVIIVNIRRGLTGL